MRFKIKTGLLLVLAVTMAACGGAATTTEPEVITETATLEVTRVVTESVTFWLIDDLFLLYYAPST